MAVDTERAALEVYIAELQSEQLAESELSPECKKNEGAKMRGNGSSECFDLVETE